MESRYCWVNGSLVETSSATVPLLTSGLHYGIAIFEGIRAYRAERGTAVFRLREHMVRFERSAQIFGFRDLPYSVDALIAAVAETVRANDYGDCYVRPLLWLGEGGWNLTLDTGRPQVAIAVWQQAVYNSNEASSGLRACVSSFTRHHPNAMMTKAKISGNYVNSYLAKTDAHRQGLDEALLLDPDGYVTEATGANLFLVRGRTLVTPPTDAILEGITRATVIEMAADLGLSVMESRLSRDQLYVADEAFVCGTAAEVVPIHEIDRRPIGGGGTGPVVTAVRAAYREAVRGRHARSEGWLHYV